MLWSHRVHKVIKKTPKNSMVTESNVLLNTGKMENDTFKMHLKAWRVEVMLTKSGVY